MSVANAIKDLVKGMLAGVHTCMPGKIESYDHTKQKASVKPLLKRKYIDGSETSFPVISEVPVIFLRSGDASLTFPVSVGDPVLLLFSERTMDQWLSRGVESSSLVERQFSLNDAIAIPGLIPFSSDSESSNNTDVELIFKGQKIVIKPNGDIEIGSSSLQSLMTKAAMNAFNTHVHVVTIASLNTPTPSATPTVPMTEILHCTAKVKAQ